MRFRRDKPADDQPGADPETSAEGLAPALPEQGPWDASERELDETDPLLVDLGALVVTGRPDYELQLPVDEASGQVVAAIFAGQESAVELRAFAAPRNGEIWTEIRAQVAAEVARQGGTATEVDGPFGTEVRVQLAVQAPDGQTGTQVSRCIGLPGPRWLLRATIFGRAAVEPGADADLLELVRDVVVVRGTHAAAPGDLLPLTLPENARRLDPPE